MTKRLLNVYRFIRVSLKEEELKVIVYVKSPDLKAVTREIKDRFKPDIDDLAKQIRAIGRKYRPARSLRTAHRARSRRR